MREVRQVAAVSHETEAHSARRVASVERRTSRGRLGLVRGRARRSVVRNRSIWNRREPGHRRERCSGHGDDDTHGHNTLSAEATEVKVFYPFHPLHGSTLQIQRRPKRGDGAASVIDRYGRRLKIPMWMLSPGSVDIRISEQALLSKEALLSLSTVLAAPRQRDHDNLQPIVVNATEGGHRGATRTDGPDDPARNPSRAREPDRSGRSGRSDGALSSSGISRRRRKV